MKVLFETKTIAEANAKAKSNYGFDPIATKLAIVGRDTMFICYETCDDVLRNALPGYVGQFNRRQA